VESIDSLATDIEYIKQGIGEIKEQTTKTNGRVTKLEEGYIILRAVFGMFVLVGIPVCLMLIGRGLDYYFKK
jgi:hypothetical protein